MSFLCGDIGSAERLPKDIAEEREILEQEAKKIHRAVSSAPLIDSPVSSWHCSGNLFDYPSEVTTEQLKTKTSWSPCVLLSLGMDTDCHALCSQLVASCA